MKQDVSAPRVDARLSRTGKRPRRPKPERHRWLDQWIVAKGEPLRRLVTEITLFVEHDEKVRGARKRARRPDDRTKHLSRVDTVVANLSYAVLMPPVTGRLAVKLGNKAVGMSRYDNMALGSKPFRTLIARLERLNVLSLKSEAQRGEVSSIAPTDWLAAKVREHGVSLADFGRHPAEEVILLTRNTRPSMESARRAKGRERIDYPETSKTRAYRAELRRLNSFLVSANINFVDDGIEPPVDPFERSHRRHFAVLPGQSIRFNQVGRVSGGFWMNLKSERRRNIRINSEPVATLDYSSMFTRLAYARLGEAPPMGDLYGIEGAEGFRSGVKMAMNVFLFDTTARRASWPKEMGVGIGSDADAVIGSNTASFEARLPAGWTVGRTKKAILKRHPALKGVWGKGLGYALMFTESHILLAVLNELMAKDIPALGLHDGLLVQQSKSDAAKSAMERAARQITGARIPVEVKG